MTDDSHQSLDVGGRTVPPGEKTQFRYAVGTTFNDDPIKIPVTVINDDGSSQLTRSRRLMRDPIGFETSQRNSVVHFRNRPPLWCVMSSTSLSSRVVSSRAPFVLLDGTSWRHVPRVCE